MESSVNCAPAKGSKELEQFMFRPEPSSIEDADRCHQRAPTERRMQLCQYGRRRIAQFVETRDHQHQTIGQQQNPAEEPDRQLSRLNSVLLSHNNSLPEDQVQNE